MSDSCRGRWRLPRARALPAWLAAIVVVLAAQVTLAQVPAGPTAMEQAILTELNAARTNPALYSGGLKTYRGYFKANLVVMPGSSVDFETVEGIAPVDEAITFLTGQQGLEPLSTAGILVAAAAAHVAEQGLSGRTGHYSADGAAPGDRTVNQGGGSQVAEVIAYGALDAVDVVRQLLVDDGVPDRGHRAVLFSAHLRYAGVACGPHPEFRIMCVIDLADTPDGQSKGGLRRVNVADSRRR